MAGVLTSINGRACIVRCRTFSKEALSNDFVAKTKDRSISIRIFVDIGLDPIGSDIIGVGSDPTGSNNISIGSDPIRSN